MSRILAYPFITHSFTIESHSTTKAKEKYSGYGSKFEVVAKFIYSKASQEEQGKMACADFINEYFI